MLVVVVFDPIYIPSKSDDEKAKNYVGSLTYSNPVTGGNLAEAIWPTDLSPSRTPGFYLLKRPILAKKVLETLIGNSISIVLPLSYIRAILCHQSCMWH